VVQRRGMVSGNPMLDRVHLLRGNVVVHRLRLDRGDFLLLDGRGVRRHRRGGVGYCRLYGRMSGFKGLGRDHVMAFGREGLLPGPNFLACQLSSGVTDFFA